MNFYTKIPLSPIPNNQIDYKSKVVLLGSCFAENIAKKFEYYKFNNVVNPFGILFHPIAIETLIKKALTDQSYTEKDLVFNNDKYHCLNAHSSLSNTSKSELILSLNSILQTTKQDVKEASHIVITLGTAWVYRFLNTQQVVANCHKISQKQFKKELLSTVQIERSLQSLVSLISLVNKNARIIFTVSPVRHIKDGFVENARSKANLLTAIHDFLDKSVVLKKEQLHYFPSYEIMMDELRDYRFYNQDMLHPSDLAIDYIWQRFLNVWVDPKTQPTLQLVEDVQKGIAHKSFDPSSSAHLNFLKQLELKKNQLTTLYPHISFS